jgi:two-component system, cell cycle sensor histidine kinase and response regulator CckA
MLRNVSILVVEDNPNDAEFIVHELSHLDFKPTWTIVDNRKDYLAQLEKKPDIILSDYALPQFDALAALAILKERELDIPLIVVSGTMGEETAVKTIHEGASDYLLKDRLSRLGPAIVSTISKQALKLQHQQALEELKKREEMYRSLVQSARDAIITISINGMITSLNPAFQTITGWEPTEWIGHTFFDLLHADEMQIAMELFRHVAQGHETPLHEYRIKTASGTYISGETTVSPQILNGKVVGILGIIRDSSERKLFDEQMREAQKMESLGTLAGGIAHDFNNILGIILGYLELLEKLKLSNEKVAGYLDTLKKAVGRGRTVVQQVLTFARKEEVVQRSIQINDVVREVSMMLEETFPKIIELSVSLDPSVPPASIDGNQLHQALLNLCVNARDAILGTETEGTTGGTITLATSYVKGTELRKQFTEAVGESYICLKVSDTGAGMDEETKKRIFDPFFTTKGKGKGTGLGLAVVYGIVQSHSGFMNVDSRLHEGTSFSLYLPVSAHYAHTMDAGTVAANDSLCGPETILLVEDEEPLLQLMKVFLETNGYTVLTAMDGIGAVDQYTKYKTRIALVLSDVGLPGLGGIGVVKKIREIDPAVPILLASGFLTTQQYTELQHLGIERIIPKPYEPQLILSNIREQLNKSATRT